MEVRTRTDGDRSGASRESAPAKMTCRVAMRPETQLRRVWHARGADSPVSPADGEIERESATPRRTGRTPLSQADRQCSLATFTIATSVRFEKAGTLAAGMPSRRGNGRPEFTAADPDSPPHRARHHRAALHARGWGAWRGDAGAVRAACRAAQDEDAAGRQRPRRVSARSPKCGRRRGGTLTASERQPSSVESKIHYIGGDGGRRARRWRQYWRGRTHTSPRAKLWRRGNSRNSRSSSRDALDGV